MNNPDNHFIAICATLTVACGVCLLIDFDWYLVSLGSFFAGMGTGLLIKGWFDKEKVERDGLDMCACGRLLYSCDEKTTQTCERCLNDSIPI